uniref:peptidylprolyl isomerase n=1 Tax=Cajanus cajan TaxID=3821 RepID=A0A151TZE5_CAJCA|nr:Peptidyl-prolyl cis-trans isomerase cyp5 [Cajanus cajan]
MAKKIPTVFMDVSVDGDPVERMVFELFFDVAPKTAENFRALCTGERGVGPNTGKSLHYKGSFFHRIVKGSIARGGDFVNRNGTGGESIYGSKFPEESPRLKHDAPGLLSMAIADRDTLGSHFIITFKADHHLDRKHVVFGKLVQGHDVLKKIEHVGDEEGLPSVTVKIINCGEHNEDGKKINRSKVGRDGSSETNSHEVVLNGKNKRSSGERRKRRKYYWSESDSSSGSDMKSSESDSDSESDVSSSSYSSSSSNDKWRKRKRSRKDKNRRGKRRDKHRDKRRRKQDKRSKCRSRRELASHTDLDSESKSENSSDGGSCGAQVKDQKHKDHSRRHAEGHSSLVVEKELPPMHLKKREKRDMLGEEEFPKENGERHSNSNGTKYRSDKSEGRQPDIMDDQQGKSRSQSMSPKRIMSKSMSISPRNGNQSPSISPKRRSFGRSPMRTRNNRSVSRTPVGSSQRSISRSPMRSRNHRSVNRSPMRSCSHRSVSGSPVRSLSRSRQRSSPRAPSQRSINRSPVRVSRKSINRSPVRSFARSLSKSSDRVPVRSISRSPVKVSSRGNYHSYSSCSPVCRARTPRGRSLSRSVSPDASPKHIRRGRGFSERYSYARRYRTPSQSPMRSSGYNGRIDRARYSNYRRYSPRHNRSPPPRRRTPPRFWSRRSRTPSVSHSPRYRPQRYSQSRSPVRSRSPVNTYRSCVERSRVLSWRKSPSRSRSSVESQSPQKGSRSRSSSRSPDGKKGLVSYGDGSPDSSQR